MNLFVLSLAISTIIATLFPGIVYLILASLTHTVFAVFTLVHSHFTACPHFAYIANIVLTNCCL